MAQSNYIEDFTYRKFPWNFCEQWDIETLCCCLECLGLNTIQINELNLSIKGLSNILNYLQNEQAFQQLQNNPTFTEFNSFYQNSKGLQESQNQLISNCNYTFYPWWGENEILERLNKFVDQTGLNITIQQHKLIVKRINQDNNQDQDMVNSIDCKIYRQWIKLIGQTNQETIIKSQHNSQTIDLCDEKNKEMNSFINLSIQHYSTQHLGLLLQDTTKINTLVQKAKVYIFTKDVFNINQELVKTFDLATNNLFEDLGFISVKTSKLTTKGNTQQNFVQLSFKTLLQDLYYQIFYEKLAVGDEILISQSLIHISVLSMYFSEEEQILYYTLQFFFEREGNNLYCEVAHQEGEIKNLSRYQPNNNNITNFNQIEELNLKHFSRNFAYLEVRNKNLYICQQNLGQRNEKGKLWKKIFDKNLILQQPFLNIRCGSVNQIIIFQSIDNTYSEFIDNCEHNLSKIHINKVDNDFNNIKKKQFCMQCQAHQYQIRNFYSDENKSEGNQLQQSQLRIENQRYFFDIQDDNTQPIINYIANL